MRFHLTLTHEQLGSNRSFPSDLNLSAHTHQVGQSIRFWSSRPPAASLCPARHRISVPVTEIHTTLGP